MVRTRALSTNFCVARLNMHPLPNLIELSKAGAFFSESRLYHALGNFRFGSKFNIFHARDPNCSFKCFKEAEKQ